MHIAEVAYATALELKAAGNKLFVAGDYATSIQFYTDALDQYDGRKGAFGKHRELKLTLLSNRAQCHLHMEDWEKAEVNAYFALELDPLTQMRIHAQR